MKNGKWELRIGLVLAGIVVALAVLSIFWTPYGINEMDKTAKLAAPSLRHLMGTDNMGRDVFSRAIVGGRFTLLVAVCTVASCTVVSTILGLVSGYVGGAVDVIIMRIMDAINSFPGILIALIFVTVMSYGNYTIVLALCVMFVPSFTRIVRTGTLQYKNAEFVRCNRVFGDSDLRLLLVHIFPNVVPMLLSTVVVGLSNAILAESGMSYLGLGIQPPTPSWGRMLYEAQSILFQAPWCALAPGFMIVITIVAFNCIGSGLKKRYLG
jgi:peptide/nickel transport system permease protein